MNKTSSKKVLLNRTKKILRTLKPTLVPVALSIVLFLLIIFTYQIIMDNKYYPFTFVGDSNISFLTEGQAARVIQSNFQKRVQQKLQFGWAQGLSNIDLATSSAKLDYSTLDYIYSKEHAGSFWEKLKNQIQTFILETRVIPKVSLSLGKQLDAIALQVDKSAQNAEIIFDENPSSDATPSAHIQIKEGVNGFALDKTALEKTAADYLLYGKYGFQLPIKEVLPKFTTEQAQLAKQTLEKVAKEPIRLVFEGSSWTIDAKQLLILLNLKSDQDLLLDKDQTQIFIKNIAKEIDRDVIEGLFEFNPVTKRVSTFKPSQEGQKLNVDKTYQLITDTLVSIQTTLQKTITLPVDIVKPKIQTSDVNSLGIKELIGQGISNFALSIPNRIYNVNLTAQKINGVLIAPGEIFSFNNTVGDISAATGFKQAYVIKEGRTVLDDGGGVCQDSTTLFRAVLNAGLPVVKRTAHAYRVGYYEQGFPPGLDATVFYPSVDFQFKNDTPASILIQAYTLGTTLYVDLYGTSDGRIAHLTAPVVTDVIPPPPDLRQDDPTLPKGVVKQVDFSARGANVTFTRTVTRNGETLAKETWRSSYKPWQAVYLVGTR